MASLSPVWEERSRTAAEAAGVAALCLLVGYFIADSPALGAAAAAGLAAVVVSLLRPHWVLAFMVATGALPLSFVTGGDRSLLSGMGGTTLPGALLVLFSTTLVVSLAVRRRLIRGFTLFLLPEIWIVWSSATLIYSDWLNEGIRLVLKLWLPVLLGMVAYYVCRRPGGLGFIRRWWYLGYAATSVVAIVNLIRAHPTSLGEGGGWRYHALTNAAPFAFYMLMAFVFSYALWNWRRRRLDLVVAITAALQVLAAESRIAIAAFLVCLLVLAVVQSRGLLATTRGIALAVTVTALLLVALVSVPALQEGVFFSPVNSVRTVLSGGGSLNTKGRDVVWGAILRDFDGGDKLSGRGIGSSTLLFLQGDVTGRKEMSVVHSEYVRVLYEQGYFGLGLFIFTLASSGVFLAVWAKRSTGLARALFSAACTAVISFAIVASTDNALDYYGLIGTFIFVLAGMALATRDAQRTQRSALSAEADG